jgi:hypothetical protein
MTIDLMGAALRAAGELPFAEVMAGLPDVA